MGEKKKDPSKCDFFKQRKGRMRKIKGGISFKGKESRSENRN